MFLDRQKPYYTLDRGRTLEIFEGYRVGPNTRAFLTKVWDGGTSTTSRARWQRSRRQKRYSRRNIARAFQPISWWIVPFRLVRGDTAPSSSSSSSSSLEEPLRDGSSIKLGSVFVVSRWKTNCLRLKTNDLVDFANWPPFFAPFYHTPSPRRVIVCLLKLYYYATPLHFRCNTTLLQNASSSKRCHEIIG